MQNPSAIMRRSSNKMIQLGMVGLCDEIFEKMTLN